MPNRKKDPQNFNIPGGWFADLHAAFHGEVPTRLTTEERIMVEEQLQKYRHRPDTHHTHAVLFVIDCQAMTCLYASDTVQQVLGVKVSDVIGKGFEWSQGMMTNEEAQYKRLVLSDIMAALATMDPDAISHCMVQFNLEVANREGKKLSLIEELRFPVVSAGGKPLLATAVIHELSPFMHTGHRTCRMLVQQAGRLQLVFEKIYVLPATEDIPLSSRELELLSCLANGMSTSLAAASLYVSENTVKTHRKNILRKLEVNTTAEAIKIALQNKWI